MDQESSTKFIGSLTKFLQSLCNGYVEFEDGVELIGHIYLSVDSGKAAKKLNYFLNEKVCKNDNSVTFISNSFHAQPEAKAKGPSGKENEGNKEDEVLDSGDSVPKSTNSGTVPSRPQLPSRSAPSPNQSRSGVQIGAKRPGSPLSAPTAPSQRRIQQPAVRSSVGSPTSKTVPSSPSSSSQDNIPSPSPARKNRNESSQPPSNQSDNASFENESDIPSNIMSINPPPDFASFLGSLTSDNQTSREQHSPPDMKPDTDVTFIKEEFVSEPSCAQTGSSGQSGRSGDDLYPVMLHQNTSVFPSTSSGYPSTATSQHPGFPGASTSQADPFSQDGADPSATIQTSHVDFLDEFHSPSEMAAPSLWSQQSTKPSVKWHPASDSQTSGYKGHSHPPFSGVMNQQRGSNLMTAASVSPSSNISHMSIKSESSLSQSGSYCPPGSGYPILVGHGSPTVGYGAPHQANKLPYQSRSHGSYNQQVPCSQQSQSSHVFQSPPGNDSHGRSQSAEALSPQHRTGHNFSCPLCQYTFSADFQLSDHMRTVHKKSMCVACNKVFNSFASLCYHRNVKHGHNNQLKCDVCGKFFGHKQHMRTHMINVHNDYSGL